MLTIIKTYIQILQFIAPKLAIRQVYKFMSNPRVKKLRENEEVILDTATQSVVKYKKFNIQQYEWGDKDAPLALLVHGWQGQAGNLTPLVPILLKAGYRIMAFDAPAHGKSSKGKTHMYEFAEFLMEQFKEISPNVLVSHSFGSVSIAKALRENLHLEIDQWLMITTPYSYHSYIDYIANMLGINHKTVDGITQITEDTLNQPMSELNMVAYCQTFTNVKEALIVHSKTDKLLLLDWARTVHQGFPQSELIELDNLGHYSILWSEELKNIAQQTFKPLDTFYDKNFSIVSTKMERVAS